ncbi:MAG: amidohydrolase family protein [Spirochaetes bacterium]|nr:amidohydrolase family protein [Spirochaetota bacterium]
MVIDFHVHVFPPEMIERRKQFFNDPHFVALYGSERAKMVDCNQILEMMREEKIDRIVAMGFPFRIDEYREMMNAYLFESSLATNGAIIPFFAAPGDIGNLEKFISDAKRSGAAGIGEVAFYANGFGEKEKEYLNLLFKVSAQAGLPVCVHVNEPIGHHYDGKYFTSFSRLYDVLSQNRETKVVLAHWGGGIFFYELMKEVRDVLSHVWYDTAATPYLYDDHIYSVAFKIIGHERILFGSDYPLVSPSRYITAMKKVYDEVILQNVLGGNARKLLGMK